MSRGPNRRPRPLRLSALVALLCGVLGLTSACIPGVGGSTMHVSADLTSSAGLFVGNDVGILGVPVGRITAITPEGDHVRVDMEIDTDHKIPKDVGAVVVARSVATDRYVELTPVYTSGPTLADGAVIANDRTRTPVEFDEVLAAIEKFATGISGSKRTTRAVQRFIEVGQKAFDGQGSVLNSTIGSLADATNSVSSQRKEIVALISALDDLVATVADNRRTVDRFIGQVSSATGQLADERDNLRTALTSLDRAVTLVARFAVDNRATLTRSMRNATGVIDSVLSRREQLEEILDVMPAGLQNLQRLPSDGRLPVRISPIYLLPLSDELTQLCEAISKPLCDTLGSVGDVLGDILSGVGGLLGGIGGLFGKEDDQ
ncbi:hypothetical protein GCM10022215_39810 [Nocardioides fonticola]|uniref:MCE family protein n=1 Tax=Nocardioides fonticola TaxID=450363 RepID=A0ABP7Y065_9ACTN